MRLTGKHTVGSGYTIAIARAHRQNGKSQLVNNFLSWTFCRQLPACHLWAAFSFPFHIGNC